MEVERLESELAKAREELKSLKEGEVLRKALEKAGLHASQIETLVRAASQARESAQARIDNLSAQIDAYKAIAGAVADIQRVLAQTGLCRVTITTTGYHIAKTAKTGGSRSRRGGWLVNGQKFKTGRELCETYQPNPNEVVRWRSSSDGEVRIAWSATAKRVMRRLKAEHPDWVVCREDEQTT